MSKKQSNSGPAKKPEMIAELKPVYIDVDKIDFDAENSNVMTQEQHEGLEQVMRKYGFLRPIIVNTANKQGRYKLIDGEWRVKKYIEYGKKKILAYILDVTKVDHKILQYLMNHLGGDDDPTKLQHNFMIIQSGNKTQTLAMMMGQPKNNFIVTGKNNSSVEIAGTDENIMQQREKSFLEGNVKQIYLFFSNKEYEDLVPRLKKIQLDLGVDDNTQLFLKVFEHYEDCKCIKK